MRAILVAVILLAAGLVFVPSASAEETQECVGKSTLAVACATYGGDRTCVGVGVGLQGVAVCSYEDGFGYCVGLICKRYYTH